jgi:uncharacterized protein GlcG (DUF336 family)
VARADNCTPDYRVKDESREGLIQVANSYQRETKYHRRLIAGGSRAFPPPREWRSFVPDSFETLTLSDARRLIAAAGAKAEQLEVPYNIAVVDAGGNLIAFVRMDGAWLGSIDIAIHKAFTARAFDMSTEDLGEMAQSGKPLFGIHATNHDRAVIFGGGAPIKLGDKVVGAIGASRGTVDQDIAVIEAAVRAVEHA